MHLYIHIPFCLKKCSYCDFNSSAQYDEEQIKNYVDAVVNEIKIQSQNYNENYKQNCVFSKKIKISTIYFGGGTPTTINYKYLAKILNAIFSSFDLAENLEISIEANPKTNINFSELKNIGFNRVSIGVQSFIDEELTLLGRLHNSDLAKTTILEAKKHFNNINIDIIYSLPNQTNKKLLQTLKNIREFEINHISAYSLIYEENTKIEQMLKNNEIACLTENQDYELYMLVCEELANCNLRQYEVSNFAKNGFECKHNLGYWQRNEYLGFGISAHSLYDGMRFSNVNNINTYIQQLSTGKTAVNEEEKLNEQQIFEEKIFLGLRSEGIPLNLLNNEILNFLNEIVNNDYGNIIDNKLVLNSKGKYICDEIVLKLI